MHSDLCDSLIIALLSYKLSFLKQFYNSVCLNINIDNTGGYMHSSHLGPILKGIEMYNDSICLAIYATMQMNQYITAEYYSSAICASVCR